MKPSEEILENVDKHNVPTYAAILRYLDAHCPHCARQHAEEADWSELLGCGDAIRLRFGELQIENGRPLASFLDHAAAGFPGYTGRIFSQLSRYFDRRATEESKPPKPAPKPPPTTYSDAVLDAMESSQDAEAERLVDEYYEAIDDLKGWSGAWDPKALDKARKRMAAARTALLGYINQLRATVMGLSFADASLRKPSPANAELVAKLKEKSNYCCARCRGPILEAADALEGGK